MQHDRSSRQGFLSFKVVAMEVKFKKRKQKGKRPRVALNAFDSSLETEAPADGKDAVELTLKKMESQSCYGVHQIAMENGQRDLAMLGGGESEDFMKYDDIVETLPEKEQDSHLVSGIRGESKYIQALVSEAENREKRVKLAKERALVKRQDEEARVYGVEEEVFITAKYKQSKLQEEEREHVGDGNKVMSQPSSSVYLPSASVLSSVDAPAKVIETHSAPSASTTPAQLESLPTAKTILPTSKPKIDLDTKISMARLNFHKRQEYRAMKGIIY